MTFSQFPSIDRTVCHLIQRTAFTIACIVGLARFCGAQILSRGIKLATGRSHPSDIPPHGNFRNTWFKYTGTLTNPGSFPSGHAITAFAIAAVLARRYRQHRWVPFVAYTGATLVALT